MRVQQIHQAGQLSSSINLEEVMDVAAQQFLDFKLCSSLTLKS